MAKATALLAAALLCIGTSAPAQAETDDWLRESVFRVLKRSSELKREGDYDRALTMLRTALDGYVDVGDGLRARTSALRPYEAALLTESLAATFNLVGDYENARKHWRIVVDNPIGLDAEGLNRAWYQLTVSNHLLGDHAGVVRVVAQWREHVAKPSPNAAKMAAFAHRSLDNRETALAEAERHVALLREAGEPIPSRMTRFIESLRRPKGEMSDLLTSELSGLVSADTRSLVVRANDMIGRMRYKQAVDLLSDAIAAPDLPATDVAALREKLAFALSYRRDSEGAREQFKAITQTPGDLPDEVLDKVWMRLAAASYRTAAYHEALSSADAWKARTGKPDARYFRLAAMSHWQLGDQEAALAHGRRYIELERSEGKEISSSFRALFRKALAAELAEPIRRTTVAPGRRPAIDASPVARASGG